MKSRPRLHPLWIAASLPLLFLLTVPMVALVLSALHAPKGVSEEFWPAIGLSFRTSGLSAILTAIFGLPLAYAIARRKIPFPGFVASIVDFPIALPPAAAGLALLLAFGRKGLVPTSLPFTTGAVVLAQTFVSCPFFIRAAVSALGALDPELERAAEIDGATDATILFRIMVPQCRGQLLSGAIHAWARALGEFGATILFAGSLVSVTQTMPLAIYLGFESDFDQATLMAAILLATAGATILLTRLLLRQPQPTSVNQR